MQPPGGFFALSPCLCQQLLAMPLTAEERNDVAQSLMQFAGVRALSEIGTLNKNAPQPGRLRGI